jgi:hypothetical protein
MFAAAANPTTSRPRPDQSLGVTGHDQPTAVAASQSITIVTSSMDAVSGTAF